MSNNTPSVATPNIPNGPPPSYESIIHRQQTGQPPIFEDLLVQSIPVCDNNDPLVDINTSKLVRMLPPSLSQPFPDDMLHSVNLSHSSLVRSAVLYRLEGAVANMRIILKRPNLVFTVVEGLRKQGMSENENAHKATGGCVSFRVLDDDIDEFVDMGDCEVLTFSRNLTATQIQNRIALLSACGMAGLVNYPYEWWTFCYGTQYFSYYTNTRMAIYGVI